MTEVVTIPPPTSAEINLAIIRPLVSYVEVNHGFQGLEKLSQQSGLTIEALRRTQGWVPLADIEAVFESARAMCESDTRFVEACGYNIVKSYGLMALVLRASTVLMSYRALAKTMHFASRISNYEIVRSTSQSIVLVYRSTKAESRLMCLSRQAQLPTMPLIWWGLRPAQLLETKCIAHGDDCCEYHLQWHEPLAWRWPFFGLALGFVGALIVGRSTPWSIALPIIGALVGAVAAFRLMVRDARAFHTETTERVAALVKENQDAIEQIIDLHQRQEAFNSLLAERIDARTSTLEAMVNELRSKGERNEVAVRGLTHDIRNPLQIAALNAYALTQEKDPQIVEIGQLISENVMRVEAQMKRLLELAAANEKAFTLNNEAMEVTGFVDRVRRNLQALVIARDIRVSVFRTREAPASVETDIMLFDRVIDNLVSNAVKYTERGSIVVEIGGVPDHLTFKISDTGRGISPDRLEKVFIGGQRDARPLLGESHGIGLSSAMRLLDELGGRFEVMSKPGVGTTIWAHVPVKPPPQASGTRTRDATEVLRRVVTIRTAANQ